LGRLADWVIEIAGFRSSSSRSARSSALDGLPTRISYHATPSIERG